MFPVPQEFWIPAFAGMTYRRSFAGLSWAWQRMMLSRRRAPAARSKGNQRVRHFLRLLILPLHVSRSGRDGSVHDVLAGGDEFDGVIEDFLDRLAVDINDGIVVALLAPLESFSEI
jgi:hypothetical protein